MEQLLDNTPIYPTSISKYSGSIKETNSGKYQVSFNSQILGKRTKIFKNKSDAETYIIEQNFQFGCQPKNVYYDEGDYYKVFIKDDLYMLIDRDDYPLIENKVVYVNSKQYPCVWVDGKDVQLHNIIMNHIPTKTQVVDHIKSLYNQDGHIDNRKNNLRIVSASVNSINKKQTNNTSGYIGIHLETVILTEGRETQNFVAQFRYLGQQYKKKFKTMQQALEWYINKRQEVIPSEILTTLNNRQIAE